MITVKRAWLDELPEIIRLGQRMLEESAVSFPEIDADATRGALEMAGNLYFMALAERDGVGVGFITGLQSRYLFSDRRLVSHDVFYVVPEARGSSAAVRLVRALEEWSVEVGAYRTTIAIHTGLKVETTGRFYEKLGYTFMGGNYSKDNARG